MLVMASIGWSSCQSPAASQQPAAQQIQEITTAYHNKCGVEDHHDIRYREATLSSSLSLCRTATHPEEKVETSNGERTSPSSRGGGKAFTACHAPRSTIHQSLGGFAQRTTLPIRSFASRTYYIYVLRHILR